MTHDSSATQSSFVPGKPVLFLGAGDIAVQCLNAIREVTTNLRLRISGPFGMATIVNNKGQSKRCVEIHRRIPWEGSQAQTVVELPEELWREQLRSLVRSLFPITDVVPSDSVRPHCLPVYLILDLRDTDRVEEALAALHIVRTETTPLDVTGILLTGRTARYCKDEGSWQRGKKLVEQACQRDFLLHRLYYMDGKDAHQYWLQTESDQARIVAEFIVHHSMSPLSETVCRYEAGRLLDRQPLDETSGTFCCRTLHSDRELVGRIVTHVLYEQLFVDKEKSRDIDGCQDVSAIAESFTQQLNHMLIESGKAQPESETQLSRRGMSHPLKDQVREALRTALARVCKDNPINRIPAFLDVLLDKIPVLKAQGTIQQERLLRRDAADSCRAMLSYRTVYAHVEKPTWTRWRVVAIVCFAAGVLLGGAAWIWLLPIVLTLAASLFFLGSALIEHSTVLVNISRTPVEHEKDAPPSRYRRALTWNERATGAIAVVTGLFMLGLSFQLELSSIPRMFGYAWISWAAGAFALIGAMVLVMWWKPPHQVRPRTQDPQDLAADRPTTTRACGYILLSLLLGWLTLVWPIAFREGVTFGVLAGFGMALLMLGLIHFAWPRSGIGKFLVEGQPQLLQVTSPQPTEYAASLFDRLLSRLYGWCQEALAEPPPPESGGYLNLPSNRPFGTILDAVAGDWPLQLASICRREQSATIDDSKHWMDCLLAAYDEPSANVSNYKHVFAYHIVTQWLKENPWDKLVKKLGKFDANWLARYCECAVVPLWPHRVGQWDQDIGVAAMDESLFQLMEPLISHETPFQIIPVNWPNAGTLVLVRRVQGCPRRMLGDYDGPSANESLTDGKSGGPEDKAAMTNGGVSTATTASSQDPVPVS